MARAEETTVAAPPKRGISNEALTYAAKVLTQTYPYHHASISCPEVEDMTSAWCQAKQIHEVLVTNRARFQTDSPGIKCNALPNKSEWLGIFRGCPLVVANGVSEENDNRCKSAYISKNLAGSEVPRVTDKKVRYRTI